MEKFELNGDSANEEKSYIELCIEWNTKLSMGFCVCEERYKSRGKDWGTAKKRAGIGSRGGGHQTEG